MPFQRFVLGSQFRVSEPGLSINADCLKGNFNAAAREAFGATPGRCLVLYFDPDTKSGAIGLTDDPEEPGANKIFSTGSFSMRAYARRYQIQPSHEATFHRLHRDADTGLLTFDLSERLVFRPKIYTGQELLALELPKRREWVVDGLIPCGVNLLFGKPDTGKSKLVRTWSEEMAGANRVNGKFVCEETDTLFCPPITSTDQLVELIEENKHCRLFVVENYSEWDEAVDNYQLPMVLQRMAQESEIALLFVFQADADGDCIEPSGASVWQGCCAAMMELKSPLGLKMLEWKGKNAPDLVLAID